MIRHGAAKGLIERRRLNHSFSVIAGWFLGERFIATVAGTGAWNTVFTPGWGNGIVCAETVRAVAGTWASGSRYRNAGEDLWRNQVSPSALLAAPF